MPENQLTPQQLFSLSRKTLEKRTADFYQESHDEKATIKLLIALQVLDELGESDFAFFLKDLVRHLFMRTKTTRALRRYAVYFKDYFEKEEWRLLSLRLLAIKTVLTEKLQGLYTQFVKEPLAGFAGS
ncbi:hypothetical protein [Enterococcus gilvus]|uniref:Uncharacterized protein n=1 Tax=Enterococcus gilvus ATCC BAA-350 TaxID=1158614 RepID=R2VIV3_9ENTE|nr:hypothetical protein [Enterococcus gilvus]EOI57556.1 hypothetical protein UKC_01776 [Enterococcus gilvus ATCC BAA-350]EOW82870.1 hypothetical protein I592_02191 [Enterococcus gilvus ATCC BAA-350]